MLASLPITKGLLSIQACRTHAILTAEQAVEIFKIRDESVGKRKCPARIVGKSYGVSEKAVRDIWNGRTWYKETMSLDPARVGMPMRLRLPGRPRGCAGKKATKKVFNRKNQANHVPDSAVKSAGGSREVDSIWPSIEQIPLVSAPVQPLPSSSRLDDPFHDDWQYWQRVDSGGA